MNNEYTVKTNSERAGYALAGAAPRTPEERLAHEKADREQANTALTWMQVLNAAARPFMTVMFASAFTAVATAAWYRGDLSAESYMTAIGPIVATLVGFWFGERAASQRAGEKEANE